MSTLVHRPASPEPIALDPTDLELELRASLAVATMLLLSRRRDDSKCAAAGCTRPLNPRHTAVVNRKLGLVYHPDCCPVEVAP